MREGLEVGPTQVINCRKPDSQEGAAFIAYAGAAGYEIVAGKSDTAILRRVGSIAFVKLHIECASQETGLEIANPVATALDLGVVEVKDGRLGTFIAFKHHAFHPGGGKKQSLRVKSRGKIRMWGVDRKEQNLIIGLYGDDL